MIDTKILDADLDAFREGLFAAFNRGDYKAMLEKYCHPDVVATWQDGTSGQGYDAVLGEFDKLLKFIKKMQVQPETDIRLRLHDGNLIIASGNMHDTYDMGRGWNVALESRWSATLVKENGQLKLVSFSAASDSFNNQVIDRFLWNAMLLSGGIALAVGLALGVVGVLVWNGF